MSVGGRIIDIRAVSPTETALWVLDVSRSNSGETETCVHVETAPAMPLIGDEIWWQSGKVYWDNDRHQLRKIGYSHTPQACMCKEPQP